MTNCVLCFALHLNVFLVTDECGYHSSTNSIGNMSKLTRGFCSACTGLTPLDTKLQEYILLFPAEVQA